MANSQAVNYVFTAKLGTNGRIVIPINIIEIANINESDILTITINQIHKTKEAQTCQTIQ
ncbi:MAG: hypothetical protein WC325_09065 [Candidatus Bathyarchaeia archaeon]